LHVRVRVLDGDGLFHAVVLSNGMGKKGRGEEVRWEQQRGGRVVRVHGVRSLGRREGVRASEVGPVQSSPVQRPREVLSEACLCD
jgi:hypothetical protein